jgi:hypothetical protein
MNPWKRVAPCIYRHEPTGALYERGNIGGRPTFKKLASQNITEAKDELIQERAKRLRIERGLERAEDDRQAWFVSEVLRDYLAADCPDPRHERKRPARTEYEEKRRVEILLRFFRSQRVRDLNPEICSDYAKWRMKRVRIGATGRKSVEHELHTLNNALRHSHLSTEPIRHRKAYYRASEARHCRDCSPESGNEFHEIAKLMLSGNIRGQVLGWQMLFEGMTGVRTRECLALRMDAKRRSEPGFAESGKWLWLKRSKQGVNPFVVLEGRPEMKALLTAHRKWHRETFPDSPWYFPSPEDPSNPVTARALVRKLAELHKAGDVARKMTSHGMRAFYVLVRRSQGAPDGQICSEIGDKTISLIENTYGALPPNWKGGKEISFMPAKGQPAWSFVKPPSTHYTLPYTVQRAKRERVSEAA